MTVKPIPEGYHTVTPYLVVDDVERLLSFLKEGLGAIETHPIMRRPDGKVMHAEVKVGDSHIMMGEPMKPSDLRPATLYLYVADTDVVYNRAMKAGGESVMTPANQFYGDRNAGVRDPTGNVWWIATHVEDVTPKELMRRAEAAAAAMAQK